MLSESNLKNMSGAGSVAGLTDSSVEREQDPRDKVKEDRENLVKTRERQAQALTDSILDFKIESQKKNIQNSNAIVEFRKKMTAVQNELVNKYYIKVDELDKKNSEMKIKLDEYRLESKAKWISFKYEYNHDMVVLEKAIKELIIEL
jgi:hypothetical protein